MKNLGWFLGTVLLVVVLIISSGYFLLNFSKGQDQAASSASEEQSATQETSQAATSATQTTESVENSTEAVVATLLETMTLEEKVGQLFFVRTPEVNQMEDIQSYHLGGYVLFGRDVEEETQESLTEKIASYQAASSIPLLIGSDEEGGTVTRISRNPNIVATPFASPQEIYASLGWPGIIADTQDKAAILQAIGINAGLFPVADVATDPNAFIYDRTIGLDAQGTSEFVTTVVTTLKQAQSGSTLKHFPGYGNNRDSHVEIVVDDRSLEELRNTDFLPFIAGIEAGADSVLVSHNIIQAIDPERPASISTGVHQVLREELGFDGVVMTDDMDMAGLADFISQEEAGLAALQAGNDLVMSSSYQVQIPYVLQAIESGAYTEEQLNTSVTRVLKWKQALGLLD